jgi:hypothetical protein
MLDFAFGTQRFFLALQMDWKISQCEPLRKHHICKYLQLRLVNNQMHYSFHIYAYNIRIRSTPKRIFRISQDLHHRWNYFFWRKVFSKRFAKMEKWFRFRLFAVAISNFCFFDCAFSLSQFRFLISSFKNQRQSLTYYSHSS